MKLWICAWPNGEKSVVYAESKEDAVFRLDEEAGADVEWIKPWPRHATFYMTYRPEAIPEADREACDDPGTAIWGLAYDIPEDAFDVLGDPDEALEHFNEESKRLST